MSINLKNFSYSDLFDPKGLEKLDHRFLAYLKTRKPSVFEMLLRYRRYRESGESEAVLSPQEVSCLMIEGAPLLETFIAELFNIEDSVLNARLQAKHEDPIFVFKSWYILREAKRRLKEVDQYPPFRELDVWLGNTLNEGGDIRDKELRVASLGVEYLQNPVLHEKEIQFLIQWCVRAMTDPSGRQSVHTWVSFHLPERLDYQHLIPLKKEEGYLHRLHVDESYFRHREGFNLTDHRMTSREVLSEANYCIYCHSHQGDFCSTGFPVKKSEPELGLKKNVLDEILTGCPLDEKISEMNFLKKEGYSIAPLAVVMVDNPFCSITGHRICNDCMKACIYQKQSPVDIPQVETAVLVDVLKLPWGVEIHDLLMRWNPLRKHQIFMKPFNGYKVLVVGMGPAGIALAHYLTMEGCAVVGVDGLKIEPLNSHWIRDPIYDWGELDEPLEERKAAGFGGVAEYGITARWDKNFLKLLYISLMRRQTYFKVFGNVRFGGTLTIEDAFSLGFDHVSIAVGAGLPQAISIPNSLAPGMQQANDFLMTLQLMKAEKQDHFVPLQIRLPVVVIGGGLTAVDAATEAQAYYIQQVEKILFYYEALASTLGNEALRTYFTASESAILDEFLLHGRKVREEKEKAQLEKRKPNLLLLIQRWGGVTVLYRRSIQESPAYRFNHEELKKALEEGVYYAENLEPMRMLLDEDGQCESLVCRIKNQTHPHHENGDTTQTEEKTIPARSILVATGSKPNIAYEFEHRGTFRRSGQFYDMFDWKEGTLKEVKKATHIKSEEIGMLTSYAQENRYVSFLGDVHPVFQGSVVKAIASGLKAYPVIIKTLSQRQAEKKPYVPFAKKMDDLFSVTVVHAKKWTKALPKLAAANEFGEEFSTTMGLGKESTADLFEIRVHAPMICHNFRPGEFYRVQPYETCLNKNKKMGLRENLQPIATPGIHVDKEKGEISFLFWMETVGSQWITSLKPGDPVAVMGPTGVRVKIPKDQETVLILGERSSIPMVLALGDAMKSRGNRVLYIGCFESALDNALTSRILEVVDQAVWIVKSGDITPVAKEEQRKQEKQDSRFCGDFIEILSRYESECAHHPSSIRLSEVNRIIVSAGPEFLRAFKKANQGVLSSIWNQDIKIIASIYGPMQCMLKGICAQCLQWQIDPESGERTKAVFACSWQDQPMELVDIDHLEQRLNQNKVQEILFKLWGEWYAS